MIEDKYHYAFLQPMNVGSGKHVGETYDRWYSFEENKLYDGI